MACQDGKARPSFGSVWLIKLMRHAGELDVSICTFLRLTTSLTGTWWDTMTTDCILTRILT